MAKRRHSAAGTRKNERFVSNRKRFKRNEELTPGEEDTLRAELRIETIKDLKRSGLDKSDYKLLKLEPLTRDDTDKLVGEPRTAYKIPYFSLNGKVTPFTRVRFLENNRRRGFNSMRSRTRDGHEWRYSQPPNTAPHPYFPPYFNWQKIAKDTSERIIITEGEKKAAAACKAGIPTIALGGVYAFKSKKLNIEWLPELDAIDWNDRVVEICYDSDVMMKVQVAQALRELSNTITKRFTPAALNLIYLNAENGTNAGLDDFLLTEGPEAFEALARTESEVHKKIAYFNERLAYVEKHKKFFDLKTGTPFNNFGHVREAMMSEGAEPNPGGKSQLYIDIWGTSPQRRKVNDVTYKPGAAENTIIEGEEVYNRWRPSGLQPKKGNIKKWLELVHHIMRRPEYAEWFLKWLAYPVQHPGTKLFQAPFVYAQQTGIGKSFIVDPLMAFIYGEHNFHRLQNSDLVSAYNEFAGKTQLVVTNEIYLPEYRDRRAAMSSLKDMITRETITVNEKYGMKSSGLRDYCNYYFTSNHADALILERDDRRFFVIEAPNTRLSKSFYIEMDTWMRNGPGPANVLHYLSGLDLSEFNPKGDALMTPWKRALIELSLDLLSDFGLKIVEQPEFILNVNGFKPSLQLFRAEDLVDVFQRANPKHYNITAKRMAHVIKDPRMEKRKVKLRSSSVEHTLYAIFDRGSWKDKRNVDWAEHYKQHAKVFGGKSRH